MTLRAIPLLFVGWLLVGLGQAGDGPAQPAPKLDRHGDPLPRGALQRLGTVRFRHPDFGTARMIIAPNGKFVATGGRMPGLRIWDAEGRPIHQPPFPPFVRGMAFTPDNKSLLTGGYMTFVRLPGGLESLRLDGSTGQDALAFSPDGKLIAGDDSGAGIDLWDVAKGQRIRQLNGHKSTVYSLAFAPDGKTLASASRDKTARLWDVATGKELRRFDERGEVATIAFSPDGKRLAWASDAGSIGIWKVGSGDKPIRRPSLAGPVYSLAFAPDGKSILYGGGDGTLSIRAVDGWKLRKRWRGHVLPVISVGYFPDGRTVASSAGREAATRLWDAETGEPIQPRSGHTGAVEAIWFSPDGTKMRSVGRDLRAIEWDVASGKETRLLLERGHEQPERALPINVAVSRNSNVVAMGRWLRFGDVENRVHCYDVEAGKHIGAIVTKVELARGLALTPDGRQLATSSDGRIQLWDVPTGKKLLDLEPIRTQATSLAFSPSGKSLAAVGGDGVVRLWDMASRKTVRQWAHTAQSGVRADLLFSADERLLVASGPPIRVWDLSTGNLLHTVDVGDFSPTIALSPTGRHLATTEFISIPQPDGNEHHVGRTLVWELASGKVAHSLALVDGVNSSLAFTPDGRGLITGGSDSVIHVWDVTSGQRERRPLRTRDFEQAWEDLGGDAVKGWRAVWTLAAAPQAAPFLKSKLPAIAPADPAVIARCIAELGSDQLATRSKASDELAAIGERAEAALRQAIVKPVSLDFRARVERLLSRLTGPITDPPRLRMARAVEALESIATPAAREVLDALSRGVPEALLTREARAAAARLAARR